MMISADDDSWYVSVGRVKMLLLFQNIKKNVQN